MFPTLDVAAMIAARPTTETTSLTTESATARIVRAAAVTEGDTILAGIDQRDTGFDVDWFSDPYVAHPIPFAPGCGCGVCELVDPSVETVVLTAGSASYGPWETCDPWDADRLVMIIPAPAAD
ncbi:hypothetical protein [Streptomyces sp. NPDC008125]|uniref:hypothetical protein n=1 Tax=Streptomyces sp. NPDC008125 TaxID=3364811 RepID=UPI0036EA08F7